MMKCPINYFIGLFLVHFLLPAPQWAAQAQNQKSPYTLQDTLRGSLNPERNGWNVLHYAIDITPDFNEKSLSGAVDIRFRVAYAFDRMQIDLQEPMMIDRVTWNEKTVLFIREGNVFHLVFPQKFVAGNTESVHIEFHGKPVIAKRPPWDGGWIFTSDKLGRPWMTVACQGLGASCWYPCKDHQSDKPDEGASISITVPDTLKAVANGRLREAFAVPDGKVTYKWVVENPINTYNIVPYIGKYEHWDDLYKGEMGKLTCDYWVLDYEMPKAMVQFRQAHLMLKNFEFWFGPYPFYEDGYKLVQSPHLGMEHQSAIAYGNGFKNGYLGRDLSNTGWGLKWDFIIVHESGHEWFANNITTNDIADMWVHEGFTNYSETLFTTSQYGIEAGNDYVIGTRRLIRNDQPIIGPYGVNKEGSGDMYYKGGNLLHTIRQLINDDAKFRKILRDMNLEFKHQSINSSTIEEYISTAAKLDLAPVFRQYLWTTQIPVLEYKIKENTIEYRWTNCSEGFTMKVKVRLNGKVIWLEPVETWNTYTFNATAIENFEVDRNFYINTRQAGLSP
jgi:aminopeptidase N